MKPHISGRFLSRRAHGEGLPKPESRQGQGEVQREAEVGQDAAVVQEGTDNQHMESEEELKRVQETEEEQIQNSRRIKRKEVRRGVGDSFRQFFLKQKLRKCFSSAQKYSQVLLENKFLVLGEGSELETPSEQGEEEIEI